MVEIKKTSRVVDTWKTKKWYDIQSPFVFGSRKIGETVSTDDQSLIGRTTKLSLMIVTGDVKKQSIIGTFEIMDVKNGVANTRVKQLEIAPSSVKRMIRKGKERIDMSMVCATKDNFVVRIKPLLITRGRTGGTTLTSIRKMVDAALRYEASKISYDQLISDIITGKLQKSVRFRLNKIYPLKSAEIRAIELTKTDKPLPAVPKLDEFKEEKAVETEEEKIEKKVKAKKEEEKVEV